MKKKRPLEVVDALSSSGYQVIDYRWMLEEGMKKECDECEGRGWCSRFLVITGFSEPKTMKIIPPLYEYGNWPKVCVPCPKCSGSGDAKEVSSDAI